MEYFLQFELQLCSGLTYTMFTPELKFNVLLMVCKKQISVLRIHVVCTDN
jgi:hypothetical protein